MRKLWVREVKGAKSSDNFLAVATVLWHFRCCEQNAIRLSIHVAHLFSLPVLYLTLL